MADQNSREGLENLSNYISRRTFLEVAVKGVFAYGVARVGPSIGSAIFAKMGQQDVDEIAVKILSGAPYLHILNGFVLLVTGEIFIVNVLLALNQ